MALTIPSFVELESCDAGGKQKDIEDEVIYFSPDVKKITLKWKEKKDAYKGTYQKLLKMYRSEYGYIKDRNRFRTEQPPKPVLTDQEENHPPAVMSFDLVRKAFVHEYKRRFSEHLATGGKPLEIEPPEMMMSLPTSLARASAYINNHPPAKAFDGNHTDLDSSWQTDPYPAWLAIDLEKSKMINRIHVYPYWGAGRYYQYTVEVSKDGENWIQVADKTKNTTPSNPAGDIFAFEPVETRYIRVNILYHNLNKGAHIVEVQAFEAEKN